MKKRIFSGIQPSGQLHIGNYLGAILQWVELQEAAENIFCVVDLHAITVPQEPKELKKNILEVAKIYLAAGIDSKKSTIFVQSHIKEHTELAWLLNTITHFGELSRMTQFKEKGEGQKESVSVGLFDYPVLMAADILLYDTDEVPVGEDQKQHVELARDLSIRFNNRFGKTFVVPKVILKKEGARIMGLDDPTKKMSKSAPSAYNWIALREKPADIRKKILKAVTDSGTDIKSGKGKPALTNLLNIYSLFAKKSVSEIEKQYTGKGYGDFKKDLAEVIIEGLKPIQDKLKELDNDPTYIEKVLKDGAEKIRPIAEKTMKVVKNKIGLG